MLVSKKFHLFPMKMKSFSLKGGEKCRIRGMWSEEFNGRKKVWFGYPDLIAVVKARRSHRCDRCDDWIERNSLYVGGTDDGCSPYEWGYNLKLCLKCAKEVLGNADVYECDGWDFGKWSKRLPKIDKPAIKFSEILKKL